MPTSGLVTVEGAPDIYLPSGMPENARKQRVVRIYKPAKNDMQSVTAVTTKKVEVIFIVHPVEV